MMESSRESRWDAIVIGSGIGGLSAAGFLARAKGWRVLVLERQAERGGLTQVFRRDGAPWDVGLHYVGGVGPGSLLRRLFDKLSDGALRWNPMPDPIEHFLYPGFRFAVPADPARYRARLVARWPEEAAAIDTYFRDLSRAASWHVRAIQQELLPAALAAPLGLLQRLSGGPATLTTGAYLARHLRDPDLRALLASQWGDYGLPPGQSAFAIHALVAQSYLDGAWFPEGGAGRIARSFEPGIEAAGGGIRVCQEVTEILIEAGRAVGVRVLDRRGPEPVERLYRAPVVISDAGAELTYGRLLPQPALPHLAPLRAAIAARAGGTSAVTLYLRLRGPVRDLGISGANFWINTTTDHDDLEAQTASVLAGAPAHVFLSFPSAKSGDDRFHTAEIIAMVLPEAFARWHDTVKGARGPDYAALKARIGAGLLDAAERAVPGLRAQVIYEELSTPLTIAHYTARPMGRFQGLPATPERMKAPLVRARSPVPGLFLAGCDAASIGIAGAMFGGLAAAAQALGPTGMIRFGRFLGKPARTAKPGPSFPDKRPVTLVAKAALGAGAWRLDFALDGPLAFHPGQYAKLQVAPFEWRDYSIAGFDAGILTLLVSTRTGGDGSRFAQSVTPGTQMRIELPFGAFRLRDTDHRKVFVATGTGLAPFLPMFAALARAGRLGEAELLFGCATEAGNLTARCGLAPLPRTRLCTSRAAPPPGGFAGRVTEALRGLDFAPRTTDFYLSGAAAMVADATQVLTAAGARHVLAEPY